MPKRRNPANLSDLERLNLFVDLADKLGRSSYVNNPSGARLAMQFEEGSDFIATIDHKADYDHFRSFLTDFRKSILADDPVFFHGICNILSRRLPPGELLEIVKEARLRVIRSFKAGKFQIVLGTPDDRIALEANPLAEIRGKPVRPEKILDLWINTIFHTDIVKKKELDELRSFAGDIPEYTFVDTVNVITNQIGRVRGVIKEALETGILEFEEPKPQSPFSTNR